MKNIFFLMSSFTFSFLCFTADSSFAKGTAQNASDTSEIEVKLSESYSSGNFKDQVITLKPDSTCTTEIRENMSGRKSVTQVPTYLSRCNLLIQAAETRKQMPNNKCAVWQKPLEHPIQHETPGKVIQFYLQIDEQCLCTFVYDSYNAGNKLISREVLDPKECL